jgi:hypothetical protein
MAISNYSCYCSLRWLCFHFGEIASMAIGLFIGLCGVLRPKDSCNSYSPELMRRAARRTANTQNPLHFMFGGPAEVTSIQFLALNRDMVGIEWYIRAICDYRFQRQAEFRKEAPLDIPGFNTGRRSFCPGACRAWYGGFRPYRNPIACDRRRASSRCERLCGHSA